ncbi:MAG TPA: leucyl aminopeptidase [Lichenihabitans sp.]|jgi:leucyl aminopeptidase|nr:leucyl aminopeptidase [Lichenihabitans sp.]
MADFVTVDFLPLTMVRSSLAESAGASEPRTLVVFVGEDLKPSAAAEAVLGPVTASLQKAAAATGFKGKPKTAMEILAPAGIEADRLVVVGVDGEAAGSDYVVLGGTVMGRIRDGSRVTIVFDLPGTPPSSRAAADVAQGIRLRAYKFDQYKTKKDAAEKGEPPVVTIAVADPAAVRDLARAGRAVAEGVWLARTLVNEPPNVLYPVEFARRAAELASVGVEVEVLDIPAMEALGMRALLAVGQGSAHEARVAIMRWNGAGAATPPLAFVGKGVCFDTGGISIKPAAGMEDMKGDMAGAACVVGLMHALASRKAKVNAIGVIGLVENMPDGRAQRPGDIVKSMSGQTIEIINTDAEGRLVLADLLWYVQERFKPQFMIDLATLTGAILVALAHEHAGLFSNNDALAEKLHAAGKETGEKVWRLPLGPAYDKLIDSKFADMKNTGGRHGGSITAAQFLQRFVNDVPWVHLDIAGTGMGSPSDEINQSWGSGWGVRLLDRLVTDGYEG